VFTQGKGTRSHHGTGQNSSVANAIASRRKTLLEVRGFFDRCPDSSLQESFS
jgi:hypothetical protein